MEKDDYSDELTVRFWIRYALEIEVQQSNAGERIQKQNWLLIELERAPGLKVREGRPDDDVLLQVEMKFLETIAEQGAGDLVFWEVRIGDMNGRVCSTFRTLIDS
jgi:hypothetical protein